MWMLENGRKAFEAVYIFLYVWSGVEWLMIPQMRSMIGI